MVARLPSEITEESLQANGWKVGRQFASKVLPSVSGYSVPLEVRIDRHACEDGTWDVMLAQSERPGASHDNDDLVMLSCGRFRTLAAINKLLAALMGDDSAR